MEDTGNNHGGKHVWTNDQDDILVQCLVEMKNDGKFIVDNGFRPGYLNYIERYMNERVPGCGIKGTPHIQSRLKTLKTSWQVVYDMIHGPNTSGFGWNTDTKIVTAPNAVWDEYLKSHRKAVPFRFKPFPHFDDLCIVWTKDRASGRDAETMNDILTNDANPSATEGTVGVEDLNIDQEYEMNCVFSEHPSTPNSEATSTSRKRHRNSTDALMETLSDGFELMDKVFKEATSEIAIGIRRVAHQANVAEKTEKLWEELTKVPGFTEEEMAKAFSIIIKDESMLIAFPTLPPNVKAMMIRNYIK